MLKFFSDELFGSSASQPDGKGGDPARLDEAEASGSSASEQVKAGCREEKREFSNRGGRFLQTDFSMPTRGFFQSDFSCGVEPRPARLPFAAPTSSDI